MFETHDNAERRSFFSSPGEHHWEYVGLTLQIPWFHVTYTTTSEEEHQFTQSLMLADVLQLVDLYKRAEVDIDFVDIVSPGYINGTERWKMEPLSKVWLKPDEKYSDQFEHVFELINGVQYRFMAPPPKDIADLNKPIIEV